MSFYLQTVFIFIDNWLFSSYTMVVILQPQRFIVEMCLFNSYV